MFLRENNGMLTLNHPSPRTIQDLSMTMNQTTVQKKQEHFALTKKPCTETNSAAAQTANTSSADKSNCSTWNENSL